MAVISVAVSDLFAETRAVIIEAVLSNGHAELFEGLVDKLADDGCAQVVEASTHPVVDEWLAETIEAATGHWVHLAQLIGDATPHVPWIGSYQNLESTPELEAFRAHYSYQLLASPNFRSHEPPLLIEDLLVGFTLQAPNVLYPPHHHHPPEIYGVISGTLDWQVGDHWSTKGPGDVIVHRSQESHAMRTGDAPVLTWAAWPSNPDCTVHMPSFDPPDARVPPKTY